VERGGRGGDGRVRRLTEAFVDRQAVIGSTRRWIESVVIGLNLCPFARRVFEGGKIRYAVSAALDARALLADLTAEVGALVECSVEEVETTLLIHPLVLGDFLDYNDFLGDAEQLIEESGQSGVVQVASFHPDYRFADAAGDAVENYTNRSPYPMLHLLREQSVTAVADDPDALLEIPRRNVETLRRLGRAKIRAMLQDVKEGTQPPG
jgi:hypothetical protein